MSFGLVAKHSNDDCAIKEILVRPEIWEAQRRDGDSINAVPEASFGESAFAAVFRQDNQPVGYVLFTLVPLQTHQTIYVQHTAFLEAFRGEKAMGCIAAAHQEMFFQTTALSIITHCPDWLPATKWMAEKMGGRRVSHMNHFALRDGRVQGASIYRIQCFDWACDNHEEFQDLGERWHETVFKELEPHHDDDPAHNGFLGLALMMGIRQPHKAMAIYNMWAERAGYVPGEVLWADGQGHSLIDFREGVCLNSPDGVMSVIPRCRPQQQSQQPRQQ